MFDELTYLKTSLEEMKRDLDAQKASFDTIKATMRTILSASSLIVSLVGALQLLTARIAPGWTWLYILGVSVVAILYITLIVLCAMTLWPVSVWSPLSSKWDDLTTTFQGMNEKDYLLQYLVQVTQAMEKNAPRLQKAARLERIALILLPSLVTILLLLALIPRA